MFRSVYKMVWNIATEIFFPYEIANKTPNNGFIKDWRTAVIKKNYHKQSTVFRASKFGASKNTSHPRSINHGCISSQYHLRFPRLRNWADERARHDDVYDDSTTTMYVWVTLSLNPWMKLHTPRLEKNINKRPTTKARLLSYTQLL